MRYRRLARLPRKVVQQLGALGDRADAPRLVSPIGSSKALDAIVVRQWSVVNDQLWVRLGACEGSRPPEVEFFVRSNSRVTPLPRSVFNGALRVIELPPGYVGMPTLIARYDDGTFEEESDPSARGLADDIGNAMFLRFADELANRPSGAALEIGSRARSGSIYRHALVPESWGYVGLDIVEGENVDVVGDAHALETSFPDRRFDAAYSIATFEHLAYPWVAALSLNRVLNVGGLVFISSHQTFPLHEQPWDYFRFSDRAWHSLFNPATGFRVIDVAMAQQASIVPNFFIPAIGSISSDPAFMTSCMLAEKIADAEGNWPTPASAASPYPH